MTKRDTHPDAQQPYFLILTTRPSGIGGIERATRDMVRVLADEYGGDAVGLVESWGGGPFSDFPCTVVWTGPTRLSESSRVAAWTKVKVLAVSVRDAWRHRGRSLVVISGHPSLGPVGWACAASGSGTHLVWTYGTESWTRPGRLTGAALKHATLVATISSYTGERVSELNGIPADRIHVVHLPVSLEIEAASKQTSPNPRAEETQVLLTVCRLDATEREKGVDTVIHAMPEILRSVPDARYVVVGDGDDRPRLERMATDLGVNDRVQFVGSVSDERLISYYRECAVFVMPSGQEGFGLVFVEAMLFAKPVIGGDVGGTTDVVRDGQTGYLVPYDDVAAFTERAVDLLTDQVLRRDMGVRAKADAETRFSFPTFRSAMLALVEPLAYRMPRLK